MEFINFNGNELNISAPLLLERVGLMKSGRLEVFNVFIAEDISLKPFDSHSSSQGYRGSSLIPLDFENKGSVSDSPPL